MSTTQQPAEQLATELAAELRAMDAEAERLVANPEVRWGYRYEARQDRRNILRRMHELGLVRQDLSRGTA